MENQEKDGKNKRKEASGRWAKTVAFATES